MELEVRAEIFFGLDIAAACNGVSIDYFPLGFATAGLPGGEVGAVKEHYGVAGSCPGFLSGSEFPWGDDSGLGATAVMDMPLGAGDDRGIGIAEVIGAGGKRGRSDGGDEKERQSGFHLGRLLVERVGRRRKKTRHEGAEISVPRTGGWRGWLPDAVNDAGFI